LLEHVRGIAARFAQGVSEVPYGGLGC
jgi:hypothetical protein